MTDDMAGMDAYAMERKLRGVESFELDAPEAILLIEADAPE